MNINFRDAEHQLCIVLDKRLASELCENNEKSNSLICYGYIDKHAGLTYQVFCVALYVDGDYSITGINDSVMMNVRAEAFNNTEIIPIKNMAIMEQFKDRIETIENYHYTADGTEQTRKETSIDEFRHPFYPDDVRAILYREGLKTETPWVRLQHYLGKSNGMDGFMGILLNTPFESRYGLTAGDKVILAVMSVENEKLCFILDK